ncbi:phosphatase [Sansalvadorimonas sp. 2012CJ34-2]|uniref:Phosphatase n=1 Tax=Parendozoicomonas callyspongiae TaxID=2942213 RepID=A0ABT0PK16_9GAMM|nr:phosphatase [Sansalvadorimonas sp. 2012CJ34-2]MCL6271713.1 phosphatase [Sansalvadorimonas sp. 2012CJ34-2]
MQLLVDTHNHTTASGHAYSTVWEIAKVAAQRGLKMFAMTDHAPAMPGSPHEWFFVNMKVIPRFIEGVAVLRGAEANILNEAGDIDLNDMHLRSMEWVIGSFHEPVFPPTSKDSHTRALMNAIKNGKIDAIGHPGNPNFDFDFEEVIKAAAAHNVLIELNASSFKQSRVGSASRCEAIAECARDYGAYITTGSDSHIAFDVGALEPCSDVLDRVGFPQERVVTSHPQLFMDFLKQRGRKPLFDKELKQLFS